MALPLELALNKLYDDVEKDRAKYWSFLLKPQSVGYAMCTKDIKFSWADDFARVFDSPLTYETYKEIPKDYLL